MVAGAVGGRGCLMRLSPRAGRLLGAGVGDVSVPSGVGNIRLSGRRGRALGSNGRLVLGISGRGVTVELSLGGPEKVGFLSFRRRRGVTCSQRGPRVVKAVRASGGEGRCVRCVGKRGATLKGRSRSGMRRGFGLWGKEGRGV